MNVSLKLVQPSCSFIVKAISAAYQRLLQDGNIFHFVMFVLSKQQED